MYSSSIGRKELTSHVWLHKFLIFCGFLSSVLYVGMNFIAAALYPGYNSASQTVSELSAIDAPSRPIWVLLAILYSLMIIAFGFEIRRSSMNARLRIVGLLFISYGFLGFFWPPMHQREVLAAGGGTLSDILHIAFTLVAVPLMMLIIGFGAAALQRPFKIFSIITLGVLITFGILTAIDSPRISSNVPTPLIGVWERINIGVYLIWVAVLSIQLLFTPRKRKPLPSMKAKPLRSLIANR
jgi:hypothetical protein